MGKQQKEQSKVKAQSNATVEPKTTDYSNKKKSKPIMKDLKTQNQKVNQSNKMTSNHKSNDNKVKNSQQDNKSIQTNQKQLTSKSSAQLDPRFLKASYDPRFLRPKKEITKVKIDNRFSKMLTDPAFQNFSKVDKYGRRIDPSEAKKKENQELKEYYVKEDEEIEDEEQGQEEEQQFEEEDEGMNDEENDMQVENQDEQNEPNEVEQKVNSIRKWMQEYDEQSSSLGDMPVEQLIQDEQKDMPQVWSDYQQKVVKSQNVKATRRLALCNYDWMNITSKDLMILFNSFKGPSGFLKSINVYQSNFGKERMEQEAVFGPQGIWNDQEQEEDQFLEEQKKLNENSSKDSKWRKTWKELLKREDSSTLDNAKLRAYQKQRLKYFYAVIQCDTKKTADEIYKECDGNQFQNSNLSFDLRFIPDDISFDKNMLKEECNQMPVRGEVKNFINRAMGHSKVQLTWEDPELSLAAGLKKKNWGKMTEEELDKIDWATYLNEQDVEEDENKQKLFLEKDQDQVIPDWKKQCNKKYRKESRGQKLVISFDSGFGPAKPSAKNSQAEQQPISLKKQKKSKKEMWMKAQEERQKKRQELTLLTEGQDDEKEKSFKPNLQDERFKAVFENPIFSIDPSNPKFDHRRAGNVFKEVVKRNKAKNLE